MLNFTNWIKWEDREGLGKALEEKGLYMLAHFENSVPDIADLVAEIIYIGLGGKKGAGDKTLGKRLKRFDAAANGKAVKHSGGKTYYSNFGGIQPNLYVAVSPEMKRQGIDRSCYLLMMERILIWRYVHKFAGNRPICNSE